MNSALRIAVLGAVAWAAALGGFVLPRSLSWVVMSVIAMPLLLYRGRTVLRAGLVLVASTALLATQLQVSAVRGSPVATLAAERAIVTAEMLIRSPPDLRHGRFGDLVRYQATVLSVTGRGKRFATRVRVLVIAEDRPSAGTGAVIRVRGRLAPAMSPDLAAVLHTRGPPEELAEPSLPARTSARLRQGVREASSSLGGGASALVPALVDGDEDAGEGTGEFTAAFQTAGMTHLLAVSGTNLTLILGAFLLLARWCGVRAWGLGAVGVLGVAGFVLLAGPEPSVLRAAAMGTVALIGLGRSGRARGLGALGAAVLVLVLVDPWLARTIGFALSVVATAGILVLAPRWRDALARWMPRWAAEAVAIPLAAQVACTPVVAAISGQVSLVAVGANIVAAPLVGPATVLGLVGGLVALIWVPAGQLITMPAGWSANGIIAIADRAATLPVPAVAWSSGPVAIGMLTALCAGLTVALAKVLARRSITMALTVAVALGVMVPLPTPGWPADGWVMVACDVGQGDALVLRTGERAAVVVDAGPDPALVDRCLRRLGVRAIPELVITHFHADHTDGIAGVLRDREVGRIDTSPLAEPASGAREVRQAARSAGVPVRVVRTGERTSAGSLRWQVLGPVRAQPPGSESPPNDASVVMVVETRGIRLLLLGDEERPSQADLREVWPGLRADVVKVAHHGSGNQDADLVEGLGARVAVISVGRDNVYGHPSGRTLDLLTSARMRVLRTDRDGDVAVTVDESGAISTRTRGGRP